MESHTETTGSPNYARSKILSVTDSERRSALAREKRISDWRRSYSPEPELSEGTELKLRSVETGFEDPFSEDPEVHAHIDIKILRKGMASRLNTYYVEIIRSNVYYGDITGAANKETLMDVMGYGEYTINGHMFLEADVSVTRDVDDVMGGGGKRGKRRRRKSKKRKSKRKSKKRKSKRKSKRK